MEFIDDGKCFACGRENPIGLKLEFHLDADGRAVTTFSPREEYQGFAGVVHGGIVCALMDEAMAWTLILHDMMAVTVSLSARFRRPVRVGSQVTVTGEIVKNGRKRCALRAEVRDAEGELAAEADGTFLVVSEMAREQARTAGATTRK